MTIFEHKFDERYAGLFWSSSIDAAEKIERIDHDPSVKVWIYESPNLTLCVLIGDQHTESIMSWLHVAHQEIEGSSFIAGIFLGKEKTPPSSESYVFRVPLDRLSKSNQKILLNNNFSLFNPQDANAYLIIPSLVGLNLYRNFKKLGSPLATGLIFSKCSEKPREPPADIKKTPQKTYDPIGSQIGEVLYRQSVSLKEQMNDAKRAWVKKMGQDPPAELNKLNMTLDELIDFLAATKAKGSLTHDQKIMLLQKIDDTASLIRFSSSRFADLITKLNEFNVPPDPWKSHVPYTEIICPLVLTAAKQFTEELLDRSNMSTRLSIIIGFGHDFSTEPLLSSHSSTHPFGSDITGDLPHQILLTTMPVQFRFRLGALPALAHEVAHVIVNFSQKTSGDKIKKISKILEEEIYGKEMVKYFKLFEEKGKTEDERLSIIFEILCDLVATSLSGPAYLYSVCRFATGTLSEFRKTDLDKTDSLFAKRILFCGSLLNSIGFILHFTSQYLDLDYKPLPQELWQQVISLVERPYLPQEHEKIEEIKSQLALGKPVKAPPTLILNALWDAVVRKAAYINEIAVLTSLQDK